MAKSKTSKKEEKTGGDEIPKFEHVLGALYGLKGEEYEKAAEKLKGGKIALESYAGTIKKGMKKAKRIVYAGEVRDASDEMLAKAVTQIMTMNPTAESVREMAAIIGLGETYGYDKLTLGSYEAGVTIKTEALGKKILGEAKNKIDEFEKGLELPRDITPEERKAIEAAKQYGIAASWAGVSKYVPRSSSYKDMVSVYTHAAMAPEIVTASGSNVMEGYIKGLREERSAAAKKKAGIPAAAEK